MNFLGLTIYWFVMAIPQLLAPIGFMAGWSLHRDNRGYMHAAAKHWVGQ